MKIIYARYGLRYGLDETAELNMGLESFKPNKREDTMSIVWKMRLMVAAMISFIALLLVAPIIKIGT